jgi:large repetitive protein
MKTANTFLIGVYLILTGILWCGYHPARAEESQSDKTQTFVFDPETKKYFIGGTSKFLLKQADQSSLIDAIELSIDGGDYFVYKGAIQFKEEGKHTIKFRAVNPVNNWSPTQVMEVFVDLTPPSTEVRFPEGKSYTKNNTTYVQLNSLLTLEARDNLSGIGAMDYSFDNSNFKPYSKPILVEKPGKTTIYFKSMDKVGNTEIVKSADFYAVGAPPLTTVSQSGTVRTANIEGNSYLAASDSVAFSLVSTDDPALVKAIWVSVDGKSFEDYKKPIYFLSEGPHTLKYFAEDFVGNKEEPKQVSVYTVSVPPNSWATPMGKLVNTGGINYATTQLQLKVEAKETVVGLDRIEIRMNDEKDFRPYLQPIQFVKAGLNVVAYRTVDRAANYEPTKTFTVSIVDAAPETSIETAQPLVVRGNIKYSPNPNIVTLSVKNSPVGISKTLVSVNDGAFTEYTGPFSITATQKVYKIAYKSIDKLGNEEKSKLVTYHMMNSMPIVDLFVQDGQSNEEQVRTRYVEQPGGGAPTTSAPTTAMPKTAPAMPARSTASKPSLLGN